MNIKEENITKYIWNLATSKNIGEKLPSEAQISIKFQINRILARKIYKKLEILDVVKSIPKKGYYVFDNLNHSRVFNNFNYNQKIVKKISKIPKKYLNIITNNYPIITYSKYKEKNNYNFYKKIYIKDNKQINTTYLFLKKSAFKGKEKILLNSSIIAYLNEKKKIYTILNTITGSEENNYKISLFLGKNSVILAATITIVKPNYLIERYIKKII